MSLRDLARLLADTRREIIEQSLVAVDVAETAFWDASDSAMPPQGSATRE